ncbi:MAG: hypothetical protein HOE19_04400 [Candidatus Komeilibacteria bacterium]|jgi:uncharacterized membrane protein|nr:hypothetical protein [Candidatus Komeilibacteria bacterium]MBT4447915.1 hypothetical protein [Candidatus Komeilibacteria bacterium]
MLKKLITRKNLYIPIKWFIWISLIIAIFGAIKNSDFLMLFIVVLAFLLTLTPLFFKKLNIYFFQELELMLISFVYAALFLGEIREYYYIYWWWDILMHGSFAIAAGFISLRVLYAMDKKSGFKFNVSFLAFLAFCIVMTAGAMWEIFEFTIDQIFEAGMQKSGLVDTMVDFIIDAVGALVAVIFGYFYIKQGRKTGGLS